jgi:acetyl esterase
MPLDLPTRLLLNSVSRGFSRPPADLAAFRKIANRPLLPLWLPRRRVASVTERRIPGPAGELAVRIYRPKRPRGGTVVFFHGGGFVHCGLDSHDGICCRLTDLSCAVVVSVDYRLAPEHPFPAAVEDAYAATLWVAAHAGQLGGDAGRIAVAGDSAGGNLAAVVTQMARDRGGPPLAFQLLYYPATHGPQAVPSHRENANGYLLSNAMIDWYRRAYVPDPNIPTTPLFAPFLADSLAGLPPALIITAEYDPLRDEGVEYAAGLRAAGVAARVSQYAGTIHGFVNFYPLLPKGRRALDEGGRALRAALSSR